MIPKIGDIVRLRKEFVKGILLISNEVIKENWLKIYKDFGNKDLIVIKIFQQTIDPKDYFVSLKNAMRDAGLILGLSLNKFGQAIECPDIGIVLELALNRESSTCSIDNSLYCTCGGPTSLVTIYFQDVKVCKTCKKEQL